MLLIAGDYGGKNFFSIFCDFKAHNFIYKGPIYLNSYDGKGKVSSQQVIGISVYSPDYKHDAPCRDAHTVIHLQLAFYKDWWLGIIADNP